MVIQFSKFGENYSQMQSGHLDYQAKKVNTNVQYLSTYYDSLLAVAAQCDSLKQQLNDASKRVKSTRSSLDLARASVNQSDKASISRLEGEHAEAVEALELLKIQDRQLVENVTLEIQHLKAMKAKKVAENAKTFVEGKIQACNDNVRMWEALLSDLNGAQTWRADESGVLEKEES